MYRVAPANLLRDREAILRLWADNFVHATEARYEWLYGRQSLGEPACVLLKTAEDVTVGSNTLLPRRVLWGGAERVIGQAVDLAVDRGHRAAGPAIRLQKSLLAWAEECGMPAVYGFPLPAAEALLRRIGYRRLGTFRHWVKVLRHRNGSRGPGGGAAAAKAVCRVVHGRIVELVHPFSLGWRAEVSHDVDPRFDRFWREAASQFDVIGERSAAFLRARFLASPKGRYGVFFLADGDRRLMGYVVFDRRKERVAKIVDALAAAPALWAPLVAAFSRQARRDGVERIDFPVLAPDWFDESLVQVGFRPRRRLGERANNHVMIHQGGAAAPTLTGRETWLMTFADTDAD